MSDQDNEQASAFIAKHEQMHHSMEDEWRQRRERTKHLLNCETCGNPYVGCRCLAGMGRHITAYQDDIGSVVRVYTLENTVMIEDHSPVGKFDTMILSEDALTQIALDWLASSQPHDDDLPR